MATPGELKEESVEVKPGYSAIPPMEDKSEPLPVLAIKRIPITEFREFGFLQELNRQFLHPLGLALEVVVEDGTERLGGVWDYRDDPEGMCFAEMDIEKAKRVAEYARAKAQTRKAALGYVVQPVNPPNPSASEEIQLR